MGEFNQREECTDRDAVREKLTGQRPPPRFWDNLFDAQTCSTPSRLSGVRLQAAINCRPGGVEKCRIRFLQAVPPIYRGIAG